MANVEPEGLPQVHGSTLPALRGIATATFPSATPSTPQLATIIRETTIHGTCHPLLSYLNASITETTRQKTANMSALRALASRSTPRASFAIAQRAGLHHSIVRASGKETHLRKRPQFCGIPTGTEPRLLNSDTKTSVDHEGRAEEVEQKKQDLLRKQKDGVGHWEEGLASDSESIVCCEAHREPLGFAIGSR